MTAKPPFKPESVPVPAKGQADELSGALGLLAEMTRRFADSVEFTAALAAALDSIVSQLGAQAGSLWLVDEEASEIVCEASVGPMRITGLRLPLEKGIVGRCVRDNKCQSVLDVGQDAAFAKSVDQDSGMVTRSLLCAPMSVADRSIGAIELINRLGGDGCFSARDLNILEVLASSASLALTNARMATAAAEHRRVQRELELAAEIQRALLPEPGGSGFPIHAVNVPARTVSGDFFDFLELPGGRIAFCLGDVSGKGMNAAMLMAKTASLYRCLSKTMESPGQLLGLLNDELADTASRGMFVTMAAGVYYSDTGRVVLANAGHEPPLYRDVQGTYHSLEALEPPLGIASGILPPEGYPETELLLAGGSLFIFSDGLTEALTGTGEQLGSGGLKSLFEEFGDESIRAGVEGVMERIGNLEHRDDLTLLGITDRPPGRIALEFSGELLLKYRFAAVAKDLRGMRRALRKALERIGCESLLAADIVSAVDEASQNVIRHAYQQESAGPVELAVERQGEILVFWLRDFASPVDPAVIDAGRDFANVRPGGLGTRFMKELMDEVAFVEPPGGQGNLLKMVKRLS